MQLVHRADSGLGQVHPSFVKDGQRIGGSLDLQPPRRPATRRHTLPPRRRCGRSSGRRPEKAAEAGRSRW